MTYIYDILLNFNNNFFEFFEWEKSDTIYHIKKIPLYKVNSNFIDDILSKKIVLDSNIILEIINKCEYYERKSIKYLKYCCLFTDSYRVIGVLFNDDFLNYKVSDLLLDEAYDTMNISKKVDLTDIKYNIIGFKKNNYFLTRNEFKIKKYLLNEFRKCYKSNNDKLKYLYFEYFNTCVLEIDKVYKDLISSLDKEINNKHLKLYELIKLSYRNIKI